MGNIFICMNFLMFPKFLAYWSNIDLQMRSVLLYNFGRLYVYGQGQLICKSSQFFGFVLDHRWVPTTSKIGRITYFLYHQLTFISIQGKAYFTDTKFHNRINLTPNIVQRSRWVFSWWRLNLHQIIATEKRSCSGKYLTRKMPEIEIGKKSYNNLPSVGEFRSCLLMNFHIEVGTFSLSLTQCVLVIFFLGDCNGNTSVVW